MPDLRYEFTDAERRRRAREWAQSVLRIERDLLRASSPEQAADMVAAAHTLEKMFAAADAKARRAGRPITRTDKRGEQLREAQRRSRERRREK